MSETDFLKLKKHDNVETNTDKFDIENYLNGNWDKIDENVGEFNTEISNIKNEKAELEKELKEAQEDFYQNSIRGQASGEYIYVEDSSNCRANLQISGNSKQETREGYNKLNINIATNTTSGVTMTNNENGTYTFSGTSNASYFKALATNITITEGCIGSGIGSLKNASLIAQVRRSGTSSDSYLNLQGAVFNKEDIIKQIYVQANSGTTVSGTIYPMINNGTEIKPFEQYGASPSPDYPSEVECCGDNGSINEVICNKNFLKLNDVKETNKNGLTYSCENGIIKINGTATTGTMIDFESFEMPAGIYKMSRNASGTYNASWQNYLRNSDGSFIDGAMGEARFTFNEKKNVLFRIFINSNSTFENYIMKPQVELGSISTDYIEHQSQTCTIPTQQPFRECRGTRDTFIKKNNKWYERHYINRLILNGTESWDIIGTNTTGKYRFQTKVSPNEIVNNQDGDTYMQGFCNRLIMGTPNTTYLCQTGITTLSGYLIIYNEKATDTIDNFKAWLSSNNLTVDYLLKTPLDIECTEEQSSVLEELSNARTYKNVTNIYSTDEISPILSLDYAKDLETLLTSKESEV